MPKFLFIAMTSLLVIACNQATDKVQSIEDLQHQVAKINEMNKQLDTSRNALFQEIREFNSTLPDSQQFDISSMDTLMGAPEKELLRAMFQQEKDITYSGLLKTIIAKNEEIGTLQNQVDDLRAQLPQPYTVQAGDTHYDVVLNYLTSQHGLNKRDALKVAWQTSLIDEILPGNEIWLMYKDGIVGSFVTQGNAHIAPMTVHVLAKRKLEERAAMAEQQMMPQDSTNYQ